MSLHYHCKSEPKSPDGSGRDTTPQTGAVGTYRSPERGRSPAAPLGGVGVSPILRALLQGLAILLLNIILVSFIARSSACRCPAPASAAPTGEPMRITQEATA